MAAILINNLIRQINELHDGSLWFDQSFNDKVGTLTEEEVFTQPHPQLHSVAEHVSHMLEWRIECILRFEGGKRELMELPEDWISNEELKKIGWKQLKDNFNSSRYDLIRLIEGKDDEFLNTPFRDYEYNYHYLIEGVLQHDIYHLGQIGITLKLLKQGE
jgi:uncharacterized damage-inducible protein DinB